MSTELCTTCRNIPLDPRLETLTSSDYQGLTEWSLGTFGQRLRQRNCPFWELVTFNLRDVQKIVGETKSAKRLFDCQSNVE